MGLLETLTYACLTLYRIMLSVCLDAYRTSPSPSLCVLANEPPLYIRRRKLSIEYYLKLSSSTRNPTYGNGSVFESKFKRFFDRKPNKIPPLGIRVELDLQTVGYKKQDALQYSLAADPPWLLKRPNINLSLHSFYKEDTPPEIFLNKFYELCDEYKAIIHGWVTHGEPGGLCSCKPNFLRICSTTQQY